jgi:hypothetical protein
LVIDGLKAHRSRLVYEYLDSLDGQIAIAFLPPYAPDLNPVEYLWAWRKRHVLLIRPDEVLSGVPHPAILEVAHDPFRSVPQHRHMLIGCLA